MFLAHVSHTPLPAILAMKTADAMVWHNHSVAVWNRLNTQTPAT